MLAETTINNSEELVYTVPIDKNILADIMIQISSPGNVTVKINNRTLLEVQFDDTDLLQVKIILNSGDSVRISTTGTVNVFIGGVDL